MNLLKAIPMLGRAIQLKRKHPNSGDGHFNRTYPKLWAIDLNLVDLNSKLYYPTASANKR